MGKPINQQKFLEKLKSYKNHPLSLIMMLLVIISAIVTVFVIFFIVAYILVKGIPYLKPEIFRWNYTSDNCSMTHAIINTVIITGISLLISVPVGIFSAIYLVEYAKKGNKITSIIMLTSETLAGIPSIVYGLFGALFFVSALKLGYSIISGSLTLAIMVLPLIMRTTQEALIFVPDSYREGSYGLGAGKLRTIFRIILPSAMPGILSGVILAIGRMVGETAALIYTAGTVSKIPDSISKSGRTLAVHMYCLSKEGLHVNQGYATAVVLLILVVVINSISSLIAGKLSRKDKIK